MRKLMAVVVLAVPLMSSSLAGWAGTEKTDKQNAKPVRWLAVEEDVWIPVIDALGEHLLLAKESFQEKHLQAAADHIREGAAFLKKETVIAEKKGKEKMILASDGLETLAGKVEKGEITSVKELNPAFNRALRADTEQRWAVISVEEWYPYVEKPKEHFLAAQKQFLDQNMKAAAEEIRKAVAFLKLESSRAQEKSKNDLEASVKELEKLAKNVEDGTVSSVKTLEDAFSRAHYALAKHHYLDATKAWTEEETAKAGYAIKAALVDFESGLSWAGGKLEAEAVSVVDKARDLTNKLIQGKDWVKAEVGKSMEALGKEIDKLGGKIQPAKSQ